MADGKGGARYGTTSVLDRAEKAPPQVQIKNNGRKSRSIKVKIKETCGGWKSKRLQPNENQ
jgi:hypothetical protein